MFIRYVVIACCLLFPVTLQADQSAAIGKLQQYLQTMNSLQADFNQVIQDDKGQILQAASGSVTLKRPRQLHWWTKDPYEHLIVTDGSTLWFYDIDLEQVSKQAFSGDLNEAPGLLLGGEIKQIAKQYNVRIVPASKRETTDKRTKFELIPIKDGGLFSELSIAFADGRLVSMSFRDSFDQYTFIEFSNVKPNPVVDNSLFQFRAPEGIDIIENN